MTTAADNNNLLTNDIILKKGLEFFYNNLGFAKLATREYSNDFTNTTGTTIRIREPNQFTARIGVPASPQPILERNVTLAVDKVCGVDLEATSTQLTLELSNWMDTVLEPAMITMANQVNIDLAATVDDIFTAVGISGSAVNSFSRVNAATARLRGLGVQTNKLNGGYSVTDMASLQDSLQNSFNEVLNKEISADAVIGRLAQQDMFYDQSMPVHQRGVGTGTPLVNGADQTGAFLISDGWTIDTTQILAKGDMFTLAGVYEVNRVTYKSTGNLKTFVVTADVNSDHTGNVTIPIAETIITSGPYKNVTNSPADNAAITLLTTAQLTTKNVVFNPSAFTLANVRLVEPKGAPYAKTMVDNELGLALRLIEYYNGASDVNSYRFDFLYGVKCFPRYATVVLA